MQKNTRLQVVLTSGILELGILSVFVLVTLEHRLTPAIVSVLVFLSAAAVIKITAATALSDSGHVHVASGAAAILSGGWLFGLYLFVRDIGATDPLYYGLAGSAVLLVVVGIELMRGKMWTVPAGH